MKKKFYQCIYGHSQYKFIYLKTITKIAQAFLFIRFNTYLIYLGTIADTFCSACELKSSSSFLNVNLQIKCQFYSDCATIKKILVSTAVCPDATNASVQTNLFRCSSADDRCLCVASKCRLENACQLTITIGNVPSA